MRTTFDLPADITKMLRLESARRGGRATAPMNQLIVEAVRKVFGPKKTQLAQSRVTGRPGRIIVKPPKGVGGPPVTKAEVDAALEAMVLEDAL